jgi:hypothetical protein
MRVLILGGTLFIGRRIALELLARGDDVMVVHRGQTEPAELSGCAHVHAARDALAGVADQLRVFRPDAVIDTRAMTRAHADAVLPHLPDAHLVLLSSIDVYRAYELLLARRGGEPVPLTETSPIRSARYPLRDLVPELGEHSAVGPLAPGESSRGGRRGLLPRRPRPSRRHLVHHIGPPRPPSAHPKPKSRRCHCATGAASDTRPRT